MHLGQLGRLVPIRCASSLDETPADPYSGATTLEGRVKLQRRPLSRRSWSATLSGPPKPDEVSALSGFARGYWGPGPWAFVSEEAAVTNVLTPASSNLENIFEDGEGSLGGPWEVEPGVWAPTSYYPSGSGPVGFEWHTAVVPGRAVTASAYVQGNGSAVRVAFYDANGDVLELHVSPHSGGSAAPRRSYVTATPPALAASARVSVTPETTRTARPALTWTRDLLEYSDGNGCASAVIRDVTRSLIIALDDPKYGRHSQVSFTIQEVG